MAQVKTGGKIFFVVLIIAAIVGIKWFVFDSSHALITDASKASVVVDKIDLPNAPRNAESLMKPCEMPTDALTTIKAPIFRWHVWAWNSQVGLMFANGGLETTKGSLMEANGVRVSMVRQDMVNINQEMLIKFATAYKEDKNTTEGINFVGIMLDGAPAFLQAINPQLQKLGSEYTAEIIGSCGRSLGEDKFMGLPEWKEDPQKAKGSLIAAVVRDGDWNIVMKWASDNQISVNPDETTYDPEAINFVNASDYLDAAEKYINGYSETRDKIINKKKVGTQKITVNGVATWTPGDVNIAEKKGGLITLMSTKDNPSQMPNAIIGIKKFNSDNREGVSKMLNAILQGGDQVKTYKNALMKGCEISAKVYNEKDANYWFTYYNGVTKSDIKGNVVDLGGSRAHNLGDNMQVFGVDESGNSQGTSDAMIVYNKFGSIAAKLYPELMPTFPSASDVFNTTYVSDVVKMNKGKIVSGDEKKFDDSNIKETVAKRDWTIEFETGKATFTPSATTTLNELYDDLIISGNLKVEVHGYTDNTGNPDANFELSKARAKSIESYLEQKSASNFPYGRIKIVPHGQSDPIADNSSASGRAKNRRVEIVLGR